MAHPSRFSASRRFSPRSRLLAAAVAGCFVSAPAFTQLPTNPTVVSGSATFSQTANVLTVTNSNGTIINWDTFSIGAGKTTYFQQTSASSAVLNRVVTADPSQIYGTLASNGKVWLINPAGIMVGASGVIDTGGFVGSTLRIGDADFLANRLNTQATPGAGSFVNQGTITAPSGGSVYLIGASVTNLGTITTPGGETILAAGETVNLIDTGTPGVTVEVTGSEGNVTNLGTVLADAGRIGMAGVIVRNSGTLNASSVVNEGGRIFLKASKDTYVDGAGRIVATGTKGGRVEVLGDRVAVMDQASIDASGTNGGGTILVGGDFQGKNPDVQNAHITYFGRDALLKADAVENGDGGRIIVWSDDTTRALGSMSARGGAQFGNGGFIETSGHRFLDANGARVDTRAPMGRTGEWLLDPADIEIVSGTNAGLGSNPFDPGTQSTITDGTLNTALNSSSVTIQTLAYGSAGGNGNITVTGASINGYGNSLSLLAYGGSGATGNISIDGNSSISNVATLTLVAGWDGTASPAETNVVANKGNVSIANSNISAGIVNIYGGGGISFGSTTATSGTTVNASSTMLVSGKNIVAYGSETPGAYSGTYGAGVWLKAGSSQTLKTDTSSGYIALYGGAVSNASYGGQLLYGGAVLFQSSGSQTVVAKGIYLKAGASGHDNAAVLEAYGSQVVTVYAGGIGIYGGGGTGSYNNFAGIQQNNGSSGSQTIGIYGGGHLYMAGGAGTGAGGYYDSSCGSACSSVSSHNKASIRNAFGDQTIDFYGGGNLTLVGGSGGNGNEAMINNETTGTQKIWSSSGDSNNHPVISITGGSSGGTIVYGADLKYHHVDNSAGISAGSDTAGTGTQEIRAKGITLTASGNSSTYGGAYLGAYGSTIIISYGDVTMTGGGGTRTTQESFTTGAGIGNDKTANVALSVYGGNLTMTGGTGTGGGAMIGSLQYGATVGISVYGDITMTGNKGAVMIGSGSQTATPTATKIAIVSAYGNITMTASSDTTGYGDVWVGSYGGALGTAAGEYNISAGRNLKTSGGGKKVYLGSMGSGPAEITLKSGTGTSGLYNSEGGNLDIGSGTVVKGPANSTAVSIQTYGGSVYGGTASIGGVIEANSGSVVVSAYSDLNVSGTIYGGNGVDLRAGATTGGASPSGGNIQLASTSRIDGYGGGVVIGAIAKGTSTGKVTQSSGSVVYGSGAGTSVNIYGGGDITLGGTVTGANNVTVTSGFNDGASSGYGGNLAVTGTLTGGSGVTYKAYGGSNSVGSIDASGTTVLGGTGTIDILGQDNVVLKTVRTDLSGQTVNIKAGYNMGAGTYISGKSATIGFIDAQGGTVDIKAGGAILEPTNETSGTANIKANAVTLTSYYGGASGGLAISTDVQSASSINATVETAATYGGISIRAIDNLPANLSLIDSATNNPSVHFYYAGPIALTANHHFRGVAGVDLYVQSGSNITNVSGTPFSGGGTPGKVRLAAAGDLTTGGALSYSSSDVTLSAGGKLQIDHAVDGANVTLNGGNIQVNSGVTASNGLKFSGTDLVANGYGGTNTFLKATSGAVTGNVSGNVKLNDGAYIYGSTDVSLTLTGTASTLYLNEVSSANASYLLAGLPSTITLDFTNRSTGGVIINGVATTSSVANGSGLFVSSHSNPATAGAGLALKYGVTAPPSVVTDVITTVTSSTSSATTSTTSSTQTSNVPPPPPPPTTGGTSALPTVGNQTIGGTSGQFGSTDTGGTAGTSTSISTASGSGTTSTGTTGGTTSSGTGTADSGSGTKDSGSGKSSGDGAKSSDGSKSAASDKDGGKDSSKGDKKDDKKEDKKDDKKDDKKSADSGDKKDDKSSGKKPVGKCSA